MNERTNQRILTKLSKAQSLVNDAFDLLDDEDQEKCDRFSGLTCDIDEAVAEVEAL